MGVWFKTGTRKYSYVPVSKSGWLATVASGVILGISTAIFIQITNRLDDLILVSELLMITALYLISILTNIIALIAIIKLKSNR